MDTIPLIFEGDEDDVLNENFILQNKPLNR